MRDHSGQGIQTNWYAATGGTAALIFILAAMAPVAWTLSSSLVFSLAVLFGGVALIQIIACILFAARFSSQQHKWRKQAKGSLAKSMWQFPQIVSGSCFLLSMTLGIGAILWLSHRALGGPFQLLPDLLPVFFGAQVFAVLVLYRHLLHFSRVRLSDVPPPHGLRFPSRRFVTRGVLSPDLYLCAIFGAGLLFYLCSNLLGIDATENRLRRMTSLCASLMRDSSEMSIDTLERMSDNLQEIGHRKVYVFSGGKALPEALAFAAAEIAGAHEGAHFDVSNRKAVAWRSLSRQVKIAVFQNQVSYPFLQSYLLFGGVILLMSVISFLSAGLFRIRLKAYIGDRISVVNAVPDENRPVRFPGCLREFQMLDQAICSMDERHANLTLGQQRLIEAGRDSRKKKAHVFASMSHDLKSPLNSIVGFTDLLLKGIDGELSKEQRSTVQQISQESERLLVMIGDILDTAKLDADRFDLDSVWVPSVEILTECEVGVRKLTAASNMEFECELEPGLPPVKVDKERITRAIVGLIARTIDSMEKGLVKLKASKVRGHGGAPDLLKVEIIDTGSRMSDARKNRLFNILQSTDGVSDAGEVGAESLGLALARRIVRLQGGDVYGEASYDTDGRGSVFTVVLPLDDTENRD